MSEVQSLLTPSVIRNLSDKLYEKRKTAALEIEDVVRQLVADGDHARITKLIKFLENEFAYASPPNHRKGGLIGLSGVTIGLGLEAAQYLEHILPPVLRNLSDPDNHVRYYACETLYNIAKATKGDLILYFNQIFDALCKLSADSDPSVLNATHILDKIIKDIVTTSNQFSIEEFIPLLRKRMSILNPHVRQFLVGWITVLDSAPEIDMLEFLPDFLDGLFNMLSDSSHGIRQQADLALSDFLEEIKSSPSINYGQMTEILVGRAKSPDVFTRLTAIKWMNEFVKLGGEQLFPYYSDILGSILPSISEEEESIREVAKETNEKLRAIRGEPNEGFNIGAVLAVAKRELRSQSEATQLESLRWILTLLQRHRPEVLRHIDDLSCVLLDCLSDPSDEVVLLALEVHARIAICSQRFRHLMVLLVKLFRIDHTLLEKRGNLILKRLCVLLEAEEVYRELANILETEEDLDFALLLVQALNMILLTASELTDLRAMLRKPVANSVGRDLFLFLYPSWCHSPMATISLCLLVQAYQQVCLVIQAIREEDMTVKFLVELDKFVRLLETPIFTHMRLQLLEPGKYPTLLKALYALLMLLPQQSAAFKILRTRLKTVPPHTFTEMQSSSNSELVSSDGFWHSKEEKNMELTNGIAGIDLDVRLQQFEHMQNRHRHYCKGNPAPERQKNPEKSG